MSADRLLFGVNVDPTAEKRELAFELSTLADRSGLDMLACQDHPYHRRHLETWTLLTALAITTSRVHVMINVANLPLRPPAMLAKAAASLAVLTGGRVELGVGAGAAPDPIEAMGGPRRTGGESVDALEEAIEVIRRLWDAETRSATFEGSHYQVKGARPGPLPDRPVRLWVGAYGPRMLRLTGRLGDGWTPSSAYAPPERIPRMQATVDEGAEQAGRDPADVRRNYNIMGAIDPGASGEDGTQLVGSLDHWVSTLTRWIEDLRFDAFVFWPTQGNEAQQVRMFAEEVVPRVRERFR